MDRVRFQTIRGSTTQSHRHNPVLPPDDADSKSSGLPLLIVPGLTVGLIYKFSHLEDWSHYEIICLLLFQLIISLVGASLLTGHFAMAAAVAGVFAIVLAVVAAFLRGLRSRS
jgi:hypothetical protein